MAEITTVIITSSVEGKGAFGIRKDTNENCYFPVSVSDALSIEEFEEVQAIVIPNDRADPAWRAIKARRVDDA